MSSTREINENELPSSLVGTVKEILDPMKKSRALKQSKGAADYFSYKITIIDGRKQRVIECNDLDMDNNTKSLVSYILKSPKKN